MEYCGIPIIDEQHEKLLGMIRDSRDVQLIGDQELVEHIIEIQRFADIHFKTEEAIMKKFDYFDYANHCDTHDDFENMMADAVDNITKSRIMIERVLAFLESWIEYHICTEAELFKVILVDDAKGIGQKRQS